MTLCCLPSGRRKGCHLRWSLCPNVHHLIQKQLRAPGEETLALEFNADGSGWRPQVAVAPVPTNPESANSRGEWVVATVTTMVTATVTATTPAPPPPQHRTTNNEERSPELVGSGKAGEKSSPYQPPPSDQHVELQQSRRSPHGSLPADRAPDRWSRTVSRPWRSPKDPTASSSIFITGTPTARLILTRAVAPLHHICTHSTLFNCVFTTHCLPAQPPRSFMPVQNTVTRSMGFFFYTLYIFIYLCIIFFLSVFGYISLLLSFL